MSSYQPLTLRYRPRFWKDLVGQEVVVQTITNMLKENHILPSIIFGGSRGIGKTTSARILAKALNCPKRDQNSYEPCGECDTCVAITEERTFSVQELDAASNGLVEDVRRIKEEVRYADVSNSYRVYIIDEAHGLTDKAWQAFLKLLEEPPTNTIFVFCTTETHKIPDTIVSRSANFTFARLTQPIIVQRLQYIANLESFQVQDGVFQMIARHVNGGMRDAISLLEQLLSYAGKNQISLEHVAYVIGTVNVDVLFKLYDRLTQADMQGVYTLLASAYSEVSDVSALVQEILLFYRDLMFAKAGVPIPDVQKEYLERLNQAASPVPIEYILHCQNELTFILEQLRKTRLPARSVLDVYIPKLFFGGIRSSTSLGLPAPPPPPRNDYPVEQTVISTEKLANLFGGQLIQM